MKNNSFSFYHNLREPIIIYDKKYDELSCNIAFSKIFENLEQTKGFDCLNKIGYRFLYNLGFLKDASTYNCVINALNCKSNYTTYVTYQKDEDSFYNFMIKAFNTNSRFRVVYFYDVTSELQVEKLKDENEHLRVQNYEFAKTNSQVQNQAVKMALLNRISIDLRTELDIKTLIEKSLKELSSVFGASKSYFAEFNKGKFKIKYVCPDVYAPQIGEELKYSKDIVDKLHLGMNSILPCLKEHEGASIPMLNASTRIIMPTLANNQLYGVVVIFTPKDIGEIERELLVGISIVVSSSLTQASLFNEISKKKEELEDAISTLKETQLQLINSEKMASLGQLIASVAHEINTPLGAISANNEMMETIFSKSEITNIDMIRDMNSIDKEAIKRISNLVNSLRRFVRLDETQQQAANINDEINLTLELVHHKIKRGFEINKQYGEIPIVECYPNMLNQVFLNILMNAVHSIEEIKAQNSNYTGKIKIETKQIENNLEINIFDNGKGINEKNRKKIFLAGFTTKKKGQGTGLGLAICQKIIEKHKGNLTFESGKIKNEPDYKTVFRIKIPIV